MTKESDKKFQISATQRNSGVSYVKEMKSVNQDHGKILNFLLCFINMERNNKNTLVFLKYDLKYLLKIKPITQNTVYIEVKVICVISRNSIKNSFKFVSPH